MTEGVKLKSLDFITLRLLIVYIWRKRRKLRIIVKPKFRSLRRSKKKEKTDCKENLFLIMDENLRFLPFNPSVTEERKTSPL